MEKAFKILGALLSGVGIIGILALVFKVGVSSNMNAVTAYGVVGLILVTGLIFQVLYMVTEGEL